jgi:hypothetical protein
MAAQTAGHWCSPMVSSSGSSLGRTSAEPSNAPVRGNVVIGADNVLRHALAHEFLGDLSSGLPTV